MLSNFEKSKKKQITVLHWLAKFGFSTRDILCDVLQTNYQGQNGFFNLMVRDKVIEENHIAGTRRKIVTLGKAAHDVLSLNYPDLKIKKTKSFPLYTLIHSFSIQRFLISQKGSENFFSESELADKNFHRRPDLLITNEHGSKIAVEVELTRKSSDRIYHIYRSLVRDWNDGKFNYVIFLFSSPSVLSQYKELYEKSVWPEFKTNENGGRKLIRSGSFEPSNVHSHGLIIFHQFEPYSL